MLAGPARAADSPAMAKTHVGTHSRLEGFSTAPVDPSTVTPGPESHCHCARPRGEHARAEGCS